MSKPNDPFFVVKEEVSQSLVEANNLHRRWRELLNTTNTSSNEDFTFTTNELNKSLQSIEWDIQDLEETISIVENNPSRYRIGAEEIKQRRFFVENTRRAVQSIQDDLRSGASRGKIGSDQHKQLMQGHNVDRYSKMHHSVEDDNANFIASTQNQQQMVMDRQDQELEVLRGTVGVLGNMGREIGNELDDQAKLLDDLDGDVDKTQGHLRSQMRRLKKLMRISKDKGQWMVILFLTIVLIVLVVLIYQE
eukprot:GCRY01001451.1.p1 GENE.GCRY01001451.1~~GCRY01001451.1.p1  ORF type:complete len:249 (+),score=65.07 GCRY01001451.1:243-989(+)